MAAPTETVALLFTDIEGSTRLWERSPEAMRLALRKHDAILGEAIAACGGRVFKTIGDAFCAAFRSVPDAVEASLEAQRRLRRESPSDGLDIKVRMAIHVGVVESRDGDYFGPSLNRVARLMAIGHGGQVLLSPAARELVRESLPPAASLLSLGEHRLKDLGRPEGVFQLVHHDLIHGFPALRSLEAIPNNLPQQTTSFVGRELEVADLVERLGAPAGGRLVTLTGSGGSGKTRLALQVGAELIGRPVASDGVWLVELAPLTDPTLVATAVFEAMGLREEPGRSAVSSLVDQLRDHSAVLVLDNCEHLLGPCATLVDALMRGCPGVRILATSREALGIAGENVERIPTLPLPTARQAERATPESLDTYAAVRLFVDRAQSAVHGFTVTNANAPAIAALCARLDGIPLALELAAARVKSLSVDKILERLDDRFRLLTGGSRAALPRQQTLRALVDWSYNLLTGGERTVLDRLSVFAGGWTLETAETTVGFEPIEEWEILDLLTALVDKSLVAYDAEAERYGMLETIRQYAGARLAERPEELEAVHERHARRILSAFEALGPNWEDQADEAAFARLEDDLDNLRAAADRLLRTDGEAAGRLLRLASPVWCDRGRCVEGLALWERALAAHLHLGGDDWSHLLILAGVFATLNDDYPRAVELQERALEARREEGATRGIVNALYNLGDVLNRMGEPARAKARLHDALALLERLTPDDPVRRAMLPIVLGNLGESCALLGEREAARSLLERREAETVREGSWVWASEIRAFIGWMALREDEVVPARRWIVGAMEAAVRSGNQKCLGDALFGAVALAAAQGRDEAATRLMGLHDRVHRDGGTLVPPMFREEHQARVAAVADRLGLPEFQAAHAEGAGLTPIEALALADDARSATSAK